MLAAGVVNQCHMVHASLKGAKRFKEFLLLLVRRLVANLHWRLLLQNSLENINADSMQVYKQNKVLTARPTAKDGNKLLMALRYF